MDAKPRIQFWVEPTSRVRVMQMIHVRRDSTAQPFSVGLHTIFAYSAFLHGVCMIYIWTICRFDLVYAQGFETFHLRIAFAACQHMNARYKNVLLKNLILLFLLLFKFYKQNIIRLYFKHCSVELWYCHPNIWQHWTSLGGETNEYQQQNKTSQRSSSSIESVVS